MGKGNPWPRRVIGAVNAVILGVIGNLAAGFLQGLRPGPLRDAVLVLIWPLVILIIGMIAIAVVISERPSNPPTITPSAQAQGVPGEQIDTDLIARGERHRRAEAVTALRNARGWAEERRRYLPGLDASKHAETMAAIDQWEAGTEPWLRVLGDDELAQFKREVDTVKTYDPDWRVTADRLLAIKMGRLDAVIEHHRFGI